MKRQRKKYQTPKRPWDKERIERDKELLKKFGLKTKREIWKGEALLRKYRRLARELVGKKNEEKEKVLIEKLIRLGILQKGSTVDDVLGLTVEDFMDRRLQSVIYKKNLANTPKQARQFIAHEHVLIDNKKVTFPSYIVPVEDEGKIIVKANPVRKKSGVNGGETAAE